MDNSQYKKNSKSFDWRLQWNMSIFHSSHYKTQNVQFATKFQYYVIIIQRKKKEKKNWNAKSIKNDNLMNCIIKRTSFRFHEFIEAQLIWIFVITIMRRATVVRRTKINVVCLEFISCEPKNNNFHLSQWISIIISTNINPLVSFFRLSFLLDR